MSESLLQLKVGMIAICFMPVITADEVAPCKGDSVRIQNSGMHACFIVLDLDEGPLNASVARQKCENRFLYSRLVSVRTKVSFPKS